MMDEKERLRTLLSTSKEVFEKQKDLESRIRWQVGQTSVSEEDAKRAKWDYEHWLDSLTTTVMDLAHEYANGADVSARANRLADAPIYIGGLQSSFRALIQEISYDEFINTPLYGERKSSRSENVAKSYWEKLGYTVERNTGSGTKDNGKSDLIARKGAERLNVEVKTLNDGWRFDQCKWMIAHPEEEYILHWVIIKATD